MEQFIELLKKRTLEGFEVYYEETERELVVFEQNELLSIEHRKDRGVGIRVIKNRRLGQSFTNVLTKPEDAIGNSIDSSIYGEKVKFDFPYNREFPKVKTEYPEGWDLQKRIELGEEWIEELVSINNEVKVDLELEYSQKRVRIINSNGLDVGYSKTYYGISAESFVILDSGFTWIPESRVSMSPVDTEGFLDLTKKILSDKSKIITPDQGRVKILFSPLSFRNEIISAFLQGVDGLNLAKGVSPLTGKLEKEIFHPQIDILDDGLVDKMIGTVPFDSEGISSKKRYLVKQGVLQGYILDLKTASMLDRYPSGNAKRNYSLPPRPYPNNIIVSPGKRSFREIIKDIDYGIWTVSEIGHGQSNLLAGEFSVNVGLGFLIENGEIVGRVKDTMISGNIYQVMRSFLEASSEREVYGSFYLPYVLLDGIDVASKG